MPRIKDILAGVFGSAFGLFFLLFALFSLPLNVIALMRLFGWEWWTALIASGVIGFVPLIGQIAYVIFAITGAYYIIAADWSWRRAVDPPTQTISLSSVTPERFANYKQTVMLPEVERACLNEAKSRFAVDGKLPVSINDYCTCYAKAAVAEFTQDDIAHQE